MNAAHAHGRGRPASRWRSRSSRWPPAQYEAARSTLRGQIDQALRERAQSLVSSPAAAATATGGGPDGGDGDRDYPPPNPFGDAAGKRAVRLAARAPSSRRRRPRRACPSTRARRRWRRAGAGSYFSDAHVQGVHLRVLTVGLGDRGAVQIARPLTEVDDALRQLLLILLAVGGGGILRRGRCSAASSRARRSHRSRASRASTEALTANPDLSQRLEIEGEDELARLARSFNATLDALERSAEAQRHLVADASHELRTPIASLRANIQVLRGRRPAARGGAREPARRHHRGARRADGARRRRRRAGARREAERRRRRRARRPDRARARRARRAPLRATRSLPRDAGADGRERRARAHQPRDLQPARQRAQVEPAGRR